MRAVRSGLTICVAVAVLAGCGDSSKSGEPADATPTPQQKVIQPGAPGEPSKEVVATPVPEGVGTKPEDIQFMRDMIHHHQQAVTMAELVPERTASPSIKLMAKRMAVSQEDEVVLMQRWLEKRGQDPNDHTEHQNRMMPGMLTDAQMAKLEAAEGKAFDRLFLRGMTQHHQGALAMVQDLVDSGGGVETEIEQFIFNVDSDQRIEIGRMQEMLADL
jgi:uncharacterized protein (DUF305 family)